MIIGIRSKSIIFLAQKPFLLNPNALLRCLFIPNSPATRTKYRGPQRHPAFITHDIYVCYYLQSHCFSYLFGYGKPDHHRH